MFKVLVDDNFHYMDEDERYTHGEYGTVQEAIDVCQQLVDEFLESEYKQGMSPGDLYQSYTMFGPDPFVQPGGKFSAWKYAKKRASEICSK